MPQNAEIKRNRKTVLTCPVVKYLLMSLIVETNMPIEPKERPIIHNVMPSLLSKTYLINSLASALFLRNNLRSVINGLIILEKV